MSAICQENLIWCFPSTKPSYLFTDVSGMGMMTPTANWQGLQNPMLDSGKTK
jgi:hypothetical protein